MSTLLAVLIALGAMWFVWRFAMALFRPRQPAEPDDRAPVTEPRRGPPKGRAGAVALEEPDDDGPADCFPPRTI
jgi:hypothetical protein